MVVKPGKDGQERPVAVLCAATGGVFDATGRRRGDLWARFEKGEDARALAWRLERLLLP